MALFYLSYSIFTAASNIFSLRLLLLRWLQICPPFNIQCMHALTESHAISLLTSIWLSRLVIRVRVRVRRRRADWGLLVCRLLLLSFLFLLDAGWTVLVELYIVPLVIPAVSIEGWWTAATVVKVYLARGSLGVPAVVEVEVFFAHFFGGGYGSGRGTGLVLKIVRTGAFWVYMLLLICNVFCANGVSKIGGFLAARYMYFSSYEWVLFSIVLP